MTQRQITLPMFGWLTTWAQCVMRLHAALVS